MSTIAVVGAILRDPKSNQREFNETLAKSRALVKGRMGIPFEEEDLAVLSLIVTGALDDINALTGKLGRIPGVTVKAAVSG